MVLSILLVLNAFFRVWPSRKMPFFGNVERSMKRKKRIRRGEKIKRMPVKPGTTQTSEDEAPPDYSRGARAEPPPMNLISASSLDVKVDYNMIVNRGAVDKALATNKSAAAALKEQMLAKKNGEAPTPNGANGTNESAETALGKRKAESMGDGFDNSTPGRSTPVEEKKPVKFDPDNPPPDTVRLWEEGYGDRYYEQKFHVSPSDKEFRHKVARAYVEGLAWVLLYYFQGCPSWTWYYPYHYAPFAADFVDLDKMTVKFDKGKPFRPYEQLMGVLPAASNHAIPKVFHPLMTEEDSDIIDFYPEDFDLDMNGKKQEWKAVVLLPFIDEKRLLTAMGTKYPLLTEDERNRNAVGKEALLLSDKHALYDMLAMEFYSKKAKDANKAVPLPTRTGRLAGSVSKNEDFLPHMHLLGPEDDIRLEPDIDDDLSMSVLFTAPPPTHVHKSMLFPGVQMPEKALDNSEMSMLKAKARGSGRNFGGAPLYDNTRRDPMDTWGRPDGKINYRADLPPPGLVPPPPIPGVNGRDNPFAQFLDPKFAPGMPQGLPQGVPPPPIPPPQGWYGQAQNRGPPPPPRQDNYGRQGGYDQYRNGQQPPQRYGAGGYGQPQGGYQNGGRSASDGYYGGQQQGRRDDNRGANYGGNHYQGQGQGQQGYGRR